MRDGAAASRLEDATVISSCRYPEHTSALASTRSPCRPSDARAPLDGVRILVVMPSIPLHGMERANIRIMKAMRESGADVLFIAESHWGGAVVDAIRAAGCRVAGIRLEVGLNLPRGPLHAIRQLATWLRVYREMRSILTEYRPTHLYLTNLTFYMFALPLAGRRGLRTVFRLPNPPENTLSPWKQRIYDWIWRKLIVPRTDVFVCNSAYTRERLRKYARESTDIALVYNAVPRRDTVEYSDAPGLEPDCFNVVYLGRIRPEKGVAVLYDAARTLVQRHPHVAFYLAGENHWRNPFADELMARNSRSSAAGRIHFLGQISDVPGLLSQAALHVCPSVSVNESLPNVVLEAKSAGVPSVVFPTAGLPEAVVHEAEGLVCRDCTADALVECIERYIHEPALGDVHGRGALASLQRFDEHRIGEQWVKIFGPRNSTEG